MLRDTFHTVFSHCSHMKPHLPTPPLLIVASTFKAPSRECHSFVHYIQQHPLTLSHTSPQLLTSS